MFLTACMPLQIEKLFMYTMFDSTLQTYKGKAFVCEWESTYDTQRVYTDMLHYSIKSIKASLESGKILQYFTSENIGDGTWKVTDQALILHCLYDKIVASTERLSDTTNKIVLETAVHPIDMLRAVKIQADQLKVTKGHTVSYVEYTRLLNLSGY
jgi:hypothetical protein